jgi:putative DNA primase/helicase
MEAPRRVLRGIAGGGMSSPKFSILNMAAGQVERLNDEAIAEITAEIGDDGEPEKIDIKATVAELAKLSPLEFDQVLKEQAAYLGVRPATLDREVKKVRRATEGSESDFLRDPDPWPNPINGAALLSSIKDAAENHVVLPEGGADIIALWAVFAHCHDCFDISPVLAITSPTPECGKTTLLTLLGALVPRPLPSSNVTPAVLFRAVEKWSPTLIIDEADTFLADNDELRGILNSGHNRRNAYVLRAVGEDFEPRQFSTWAPKAIAKIGRMPPTLYSRSIRIELQRKTAEETVEPLRADRLAHLEPFQRKAARWAQDNAGALKASDPEIPSAMYSRIADNWRSLFAIADLAGDDWPERARRIAEAFVTKSSDETRAIVLLGDIEDAFNGRRVDHLHSDDLIADLVAMEDRPWSEWGRGQRPITKNQLAGLLKPFGVAPKQIKIGAINKRGYTRDAFEGLFARYLPDRGSQSVTPLPPLENKALRVVQSATATLSPDRPVALRTGGNPLETKDGSGVALQNPQSGGENNDAFASLKDKRWTLGPR